MTAHARAAPPDLHRSQMHRWSERRTGLVVACDSSSPCYCFTSAIGLRSGRRHMPSRHRTMPRPAGRRYGLHQYRSLHEPHSPLAPPPGMLACFSLPYVSHMSHLHHSRAHYASLSFLAGSCDVAHLSSNQLIAGLNSGLGKSFLLFFS